MSDSRAQVLTKAKWLQWISIVVQLLTVALMMAVSGESQAMKAAWVEDALSLLPPIAFLVATRVAKRKRSEQFPYGYFRSIGIAHLVAGVALLGMGLLLVYESASSLLMAEKPPIGIVVFDGHAIWAGWLMILVMLITIPPPMILARMKLKLAPKLHDKVLFADADMNKANWDTGLGTVVGILGIGFGLWWTDSAVAALIALSIIRDGFKNVKSAVTDLMDTRVTTFDERVPRLLEEVDSLVASIPWVQQYESRIRDQGHVFHCETFVVPRHGAMPSLDELESLRSRIENLDWKLHDVVVAPVQELPSKELPTKR